jgi:Flp pilus assembly protein TadD
MNPAPSETIPLMADVWVDEGLRMFGIHDYAAAAHAFRQALSIETDNADIVLKLGAALSAAGDVETAIGHYRAVLEREPDHRGALINLGTALVRLGRYEEAIESLAQAARLSPESGLAHFNLGVALQAIDRLDDAVLAYRTAQCDAGISVRAAANLGSVLARLGRHEEALSVYDAALAVSSDDANLHWNRASALLLLGDYDRGWRAYEWRWRTSSYAHAPRHQAAAPWNGKRPLNGARILLHAEQGFGDTIQFARYVPCVAAMGGRVILEVQPTLKRLFAGFPGVEEVYAVGEELPPFEIQCPLLGLPLRVDGMPSATPYLQTPPAPAGAYRDAYRPNHLHVGLVWAGSSTNSADQRRSLDLAQLQPLSRAHQAVFVNLQAGAAAEGLGAFGATMLNPMRDVRDFADTANIVAALDLVISVDTAVAHLAGALGKPVWLLNRFDGCWRWQLDREDTPWYPTMRIFRQPRLGDWVTVVDRIATELAALSNLRAPV